MIFFYVIVKKGAFRIEIVEQWGKKMSDCLVLLRINRTFVANYLPFVARLPSHAD